MGLRRIAWGLHRAIYTGLNGATHSYIRLHRRLNGAIFTGLNRATQGYLGLHA